MPLHPIDVLVGKRLRQRRVMLGFTQEVLAEKVGISFQQVQKYEHGTNRISCSRLYEFAVALTISPLYFFEDADKTVFPPFGNEARLIHSTDEKADQDFINVVKSYKSLTPKMRKTLADFIKALAYKKLSEEA